MVQLENLAIGAVVRGILPDSQVTVVSVQWFGSEALELTYKTPTGNVANQVVYRHDEPGLEIVQKGRAWSFDGEGNLFRLVSEVWHGLWRSRVTSNPPCTSKVEGSSLDPR